MQNKENKHPWWARLIVAFLLILDVGANVVGFIIDWPYLCCVTGLILPGLLITAAII